MGALVSLAILLALLATGIVGAQAPVTELVSVGSGVSEGNGVSDDPSSSSDGRYVAFHSYAINLVACDTNGKADVFVRGPLWSPPVGGVSYPLTGAPVVVLALGVAALGGAVWYVRRRR